MVGLFTLLLGLAAPLAVTGIAAALMPGQAGSSLVQRDGRIVGSELLGQSFTEARYFHPRPSATVAADPAEPGATRPAPYNGAASAASQLGPTSAALVDAVRGRVAALGGGTVPADAATASGSGLDPHVSVENALRQVPRVAQARGLPEQRVQGVLEMHRSDREWGLLGEPRVNVLRLNLALDRLR